MSSKMRETAERILQNEIVLRQVEEKDFVPDFIMTADALAQDAKLLAQHTLDTLAEQPCPYIVTSKGGTSYCRLAESNGAMPVTLAEGVDEERLSDEISEALSNSEQLGMTGYTDEACEAILAIFRPFLRTKPIPAQPGEGELLPCPWCESAEKLNTEDNDAGSVWIVCSKKGCGCEGPYGRTEKEAIEKWNTRQPLTAPAGDGEVSEWQPIDMAPRDGRPVDLWIKPFTTNSNDIGFRQPNCFFIEGRWRNNYMPDDFTNNFILSQASHYMLPPSAPADIQQKGQTDA